MDYDADVIVSCDNCYYTGAIKSFHIREAYVDDNIFDTSVMSFDYVCPMCGTVFGDRVYADVSEEVEVTDK